MSRRDEPATGLEKFEGNQGIVASCDKLVSKQLMVVIRL